MGWLFCCFFYILVDEEREDPKTLKTDHDRSTSETPFKWRLAGGPTVVQH